LIFFFDNWRFVNSKIRPTFAFRKNNDYLEEWQTCLPITRIKLIIIRGVAEWFAKSFGSSLENLKELKKHRGVAEWSIAAVLKTVVPRGTGGSNPSSSAKEKPGA
jgi:hypothetical protein